jgi:hypothetical protein
MPLAQYARAIYLAPLATAIPVTIFAVWCHGFSGSGWLAIGGAAISIAVFYYALAARTVLERPHRLMLAGWIRRQGWFVQPASLEGRLYSSHQLD